MADQIIVAKIIEEALGSPKEHVEDSLKALVEKIKQQHNVKTYTLYEATPVETLWSSFVELEIEFKNANTLTGYCFDFMPSSVEIISPSKLPLTSREVDDLLNDLAARLHRQDAILRNLEAENKLLKKDGKKI